MKVSERIKKAFFCMDAAALTLMSSFHSYADGELEHKGSGGDAFDVSFLTDDTAGGDMFSDVTNQAKGLFASAYSLVTVCCAAISVFFLILIGIRMMSGGRKREDAKDDLLWFFIGGALVFGAISVVSIVSGVFSKM